MLVLYICLGILVFLLALMFLYVKVQIAARLAHDGDSRLIIIEIVSGFNKQKKEFRYDDLDLNISSLLTILRQENNRGGTDWKKSFQVLPNTLFQLQDYFKILNLVLRYIVVEKLDWRTALGLNDAMNTAVSTGSLWAFKGIFVSILSSRSHLKDLIINVEPDFSTSRFWSRLDCILKMRIVHIIIIGIYALGFIIKRRFKSLVNRLTINGGIYKWIYSRKSRDIPLKD